MSLFAAARVSCSPLVSGRGVLGVARLTPRALHASAKVSALPWAKQAPTVSVTPEQDLKNLNVARNQRPISPHLSIYQPQLTWLSSIANRITGAGMSALLYAGAIGYVAAPYMGLADVFTSASVVDAVAHLSPAVKMAIKAPLAATFTYHFWNGLRHLSWDLGLCTYNSALLTQS